MSSMSTLERLARALTAGSSSPPPTTPEPVTPSPARSDAPAPPFSRVCSPYVTESLTPPPTTPEPVTPSPARSGEPPPSIEGLPANPVRHRHEPRPLTAWYIDPENPGEPYPRTQSMRAWAQELGLQYATLRWRIAHGWPDMEALGLLPHVRDYGAEQRPAGNAGAAVLVVERVDRSVDSAAAGAAAGSTLSAAAGSNWRVVPRVEVAEYLGIKLASVAQRLRQYRTADGSQARVELSTLAARGRRRRTD